MGLKPDKLMKKSAGILLFKRGPQGLQVLLVHPGGPFWAKKDHGAWSLPKGELTGGEDGLSAARREFKEETGYDIGGDFVALTPVTQSNNKVNYAWATEGDLDAKRIRSNSFEIEWPPRLGRTQRFPEVDRAAWFGLAEAEQRIQRGQWPILLELATRLGIRSV